MAKKKVVAVIGLEIIGRNPSDLSCRGAMNAESYILRITSKSEPTTPDYAS